MSSLLLSMPAVTRPLACLFLIGPGFHTSPVAGAEPVRVSPDTVGSLVREANPRLAAARLLIEEARGRHRQSGRLPNPQFESAFDHDLDFREVSLEVGFSQAFPVTARLRHEKLVSDLGIRIARAEVADVERQLIGRGRESVVHYLATDARRHLLEKQAELVLELADSIAEAASKGEGSILDAGRAKLEARRLAIRIRHVEAESARSLGEIRSLLGLERGARLAVAGKMPAPSPVSTTSVNPRHRPDYRAALLAIESAGGEVELEKARRRPDLTAGVFAGGERFSDLPVGLRDEARLGIRLSVPIPHWNRNEGSVQEKSAKRLRMQKQAAAIASEIYHESLSAREEIEVHLGILVEVEKKLLPLAVKQVGDTETAYRESQATLQDVLRSREDLLQLELTRLDALRDANLARVLYETVTGHHAAR